MRRHFRLHHAIRRRPARGFLLLEVIIALTVFAIVGVGLAVALHESIDSANFLRREAMVRRGLEAMLIEAKAKPKRGEMAFSQRDEALGVDYETKIEPLELLNRDREPVEGLYLLKAFARYSADGKPIEDSVEIYVHRP